MLNSVFTNICANYTNDTEKVDELWNELEIHYSNENRYYHTFLHLEHMYIQLSAVKEKIKNWNLMMFSLFYHDIIYDVLKNDNEQSSALIAEKRLNQILLPKEMILNCCNQILSTKNHEISDDTDTNFFLDADLSILGHNLQDYISYMKNIRKEYSIYPNEIYNDGRTKVLNHFLSMPRIYKTDYFYNQFEKSAKSNLAFELNIYQNNL